MFDFVLNVLIAFYLDLNELDRPTAWSKNRGQRNFLLLSLKFTFFHELVFHKFKHVLVYMRILTAVCNVLFCCATALLLFHLRRLNLDFTD